MAQATEPAARQYPKSTEPARRTNSGSSHRSAQINGSTRLQNLETYDETSDHTRCANFYRETLTFALLLISLFSGSSLTAAAMSKDSFNVDPRDPTERAHSVFSISLIFGILSVLYALAGMLLNCIGRLPGKVSSSQTEPHERRLDPLLTLSATLPISTGHAGCRARS